MEQQSRVFFPLLLGTIHNADPDVTHCGEEMGTFFIANKLQWVESTIDREAYGSHMRPQQEVVRNGGRFLGGRLCFLVSWTF